LWLVRWRHRGAAPNKWGWTVYARSTSVQAQPSNIDAGVAYVRDEVMPALAAMDGYIGLSMLVDRDRAREIFGGDVTLDQWEIGVLHRDHRSNDGACVRVTWLKVPPDQADRSIDFYKSAVLPSLADLDGFCSASYLINRGSGRAVSSATFDSREAMHHNEEQARELRNTRTRELGADILDVGEFELALAHLRVPEMA
jgi:hypothetical protein